MSLAYFPLYPGDFEADTAHLTLAEDGAYNRLLRLCWRTPGCSLPDDRQWIYRKMRAQTDEDKAVIDIVLDEFFQVKAGRVFNPRLAKEWQKTDLAHRKRVSAGSKGGKSKALKTNETAPSNAVAKPKQPEPEPEPDIEEEVEGAREPSPDFLERCVEAAGIRDRWPAYWAAPAAILHVQRWVTDLGLSEDEVISAIQHSARNHSQPANGPKAFDRVLQNLAAEKAAPRLQPIEGGRKNGPPHNPDRVQRIITAAAAGTSNKDWG